jgi:two-component system response regulator YesN
VIWRSLKSLSTREHLSTIWATFYLKNSSSSTFTCNFSAVDYLLKPSDVEEIEEALAKAKALGGEQEASLQDEGSMGKAEEPASYLIKMALNVMSSKFTEDIHLSEIVDELCVTPNYLSRLFRQETGRSFSDYLSDLRMEKAIELLKSSKLKIYQIGDAVGYSNPRYFSEWFQKHTGMLPGDYRKHHAI